MVPPRWPPFVTRCGTLAWEVDLLNRLASLARAIAREPSLEVVRGPPGCGWRTDVRRGRIEIEPADLDTLEEPELFGLICHEAAHGALTRYPFLVPRVELNDLRVSVVLNALEDCRIERWLVERMPGSRPWLHTLNDRLFPADAVLDHLHPVLQYAIGTIHHWWHGELPAGLTHQVADALRGTIAERRAYEACQPDRAPAYGGRVAERFRRLEGERHIDASEGAVRMAAAAALEHANALLPTVLALGMLTEDPAMRSFVQQTGVQLEHIPGGRGGLAPIDEQGRRAALRPAREGWDALQRELLPQIRRLSRTLEQVLAPDRQPRFVPSQTAAHRVDLRKAMQHAADPRVPVWLRKTTPHKRDHAFTLLVDVSGSMRGERIAAALRGTVLLAEVLDRLGIRFAVEGFQDEAFELKPMQRSLRSCRQALLDMPLEVAGVRRGGHNQPDHNHDGPALLAAAERLLSHGARTPVLIVVGDGEPSGPEPAVATLHRAVEQVGAQLHLIGLGLGQGTAAVAEHYPEHLVDIDLAVFPDALGDLLIRLLRDAGGRR